MAFDSYVPWISTLMTPLLMPDSPVPVERTTIDSIPDEILTEILQLSTDATFDRHLPRNLIQIFGTSENRQVETIVQDRIHARSVRRKATLTLVNQRCRRLTVPLLFHRVVVRRVRSAQRLADFLDSRGGRANGLSIRSLELRAVPLPLRSTDASIYISTITKIAALSPNLRRFSTSWAFPMPAPGWGILRELHRTLSALPLEEFVWACPNRWTLFDLNAFLRSQRGLRHLTLEDLHPLMNVEVGFQNLRSLQIRCQYHEPMDGLERIVAPQLESLYISPRHLSTIHPDSWQAGMGATIEKLILLGNDFEEEGFYTSLQHPRHHLSNYLKMCSRLVSLTIGVIPGFNLPQLDVLVGPAPSLRVLVLDSTGIDTRVDPWRHPGNVRGSPFLQLLRMIQPASFPRLKDMKFRLVDLGSTAAGPWLDWIAEWAPQFATRDIRLSMEFWDLTVPSGPM